MTRQRDIALLQYRHPNQVNLTVPIRPGSSKFKVKGAARLNDAYGNVAGVGGYGTIDLFEVTTGSTFRSSSIQSRKLPAVEEATRGLTRVVFDPDDYARPFNASASYFPPDDNLSFLRIQPFNDSSGAYLSEGPILVLPSYDFYTTKGPVVTLTGIAPNLDIGAFPSNIPDFMPDRALNFLLPNYLSTISLVNLSALVPLFFSCHPGNPPSVLPPGGEMTLTGGGAPELFLASPSGNPWFTLRASVINSA